MSSNFGDKNMLNKLMKKYSIHQHIQLQSSISPEKLAPGC